MPRRGTDRLGQLVRSSSTRPTARSRFPITGTLHCLGPGGDRKPHLQCCQQRRDRINARDDRLGRDPQWWQLRGLTTVSGSVDIETPSVAGEFVFYNNSKFDGNPPRIQHPILRRSQPTRRHCFRVARLPLETTTRYRTRPQRDSDRFAKLAPGIVLSGTDFQFKVGNNSTPSGWAAGPADFRW